LTGFLTAGRSVYQAVELSKLTGVRTVGRSGYLIAKASKDKFCRAHIRLENHSWQRSHHRLMQPGSMLLCSLMKSQSSFRLMVCISFL